MPRNGAICVGPWGWDSGDETGEDATNIATWWSRSGRLLVVYAQILRGGWVQGNWKFEKRGGAMNDSLGVRVQNLSFSRILVLRIFKKRSLALRPGNGENRHSPAIDVFLNFRILPTEFSKTRHPLLRTGRCHLNFLTGRKQKDHPLKLPLQEQARVWGIP